MISTDNVAPAQQQKTITIKRVFDLPIDIVWQAWTEEESFKKWWGPKEYSCPYCSIDFKIGGKTLACMKAIADGKETWSSCIYKEIVPQKKIMYIDSFSDKEGNMVPSTNYDMPEMPLELPVTLEFEQVGGKTTMTLQHEGLPAAMAEDCIKGWQSSFDKLENNLK